MHPGVAGMVFFRSYTHSAKPNFCFVGVFFVSILHLMVDIVYQKEYLFVTHSFSYLFYSPLDYRYLLKTDYLGDKFPQLQTTLEIET